MWPFTSSRVARHRAERVKAAAAIMFLTIFVFAAALLMVQAFQHPTPHQKIATSSAANDEFPYITGTLSPALFHPKTTGAGNAANEIDPRGDEAQVNRGLVPTNKHAIESVTRHATSAHVDFTAAFNSITGSIKAITFDTKITMATTTSGDLPDLSWMEKMLPNSTWDNAQPSFFKSGWKQWDGSHATITTIDPSSYTMGLLVAITSDLPVAITTMSTDGQVVAPSDFSRSHSTRSQGQYLSPGLEPDQGASSSSSTSTDTPFLLVSASATEASISQTPQATMTQATTESEPLMLTTTTFASTHPNLFTPHATFCVGDMSHCRPSITVATQGAVISTSQDPAGASGESRDPNDNGKPTMIHDLPFSSAHSLPASSLTGIEPGISVSPTQGAPTTIIDSVASSVSSVVSSFTAEPTSSVSTTSFSRPPTQVQSIPVTAAPTTLPPSTSTPLPSAHDSKKGLSIGLGVCLPIVFLSAAAFVLYWLITRRIERKKKDDLEKNVIWATTPPSTQNGSGTLLNMTGMDGAVAGVKKTEGAKASPPVSPLSMNPLNEEELAIARKYGLAIDDAQAGQTSGRSPKRTIQRRSGGTSLTRQWFDGTNDSPPPASSAYHLDPFSDANAIGLAVSTNDLYRFQPNRLSTISDRSGESEVPDMPTASDSSELMTDGGHGRGRPFERFLMKRKGMLPL